MIRALTHAVRPTRLRAVLATFLVAVVGTACNSTDVTDPTSAAPVPTATSTTDAVPATATPLASLTSGIPYAPTSLWATATTLSAGAAPFTGSQVALDPGALLTVISTARQKGQRIVLAMTGGSAKQYLTNGKFDVNK